MDESYLTSLLLLPVLLMIHALIVAAYAAVAHSPRETLRDMTEAGSSRAERSLRLSEDLPRLDMTVQISLLLLRVLLFTLATIIVTLPPPGALSLLVPPVGYLVVLVPLTLAVYIFGDLLPTALGRSRSRRIIPFAAPLLRGLTLLLSPLVAPLYLLRDHLFDEPVVVSLATDEEIISIMDEKGGIIETEEKEMILSVLEFGETVVREVMVPRIDVTALALDSSIDDALATFISSGHSRVPVYEETIDDIKGLLYAKDLLGLWRGGDAKPIRDLMRPAYFVPETKRAETLFREMQKSKIHIAIVVDEYGGTAGLVTIEDLVEEIVGDIQDEYDLNEEADYVQQGTDEYLVDATMNIDDFNDLLEVELSTEDNDTLGGFVFGQLGRVPDSGDTLTIPEQHLTIRVEAVEGRRIRKLHVTRRRPEPADEATGEETSTGEQPPVDPRRTTGVNPEVRAATSR